jgi:AraC-like DNA-binding protein
MPVSIDALLAENQELKTRIRHLALEHSILNELDFPAEIPTLAEYFQCEFDSEDLILAVIHAQSDPQKRHTAGGIDPLTSNSGLPVLYYPMEAMDSAEQICREVFGPQTQSIVFRAMQDVGVLLCPSRTYLTEHNIRSGNYYAQVLLQLEVVVRRLNASLSFQNIATVSAQYHGQASLRAMYLETKDTYDYSWNLTGTVFAYPKLFSSPNETKERLEINTLELEFLNDVNRLLFFEASVVLDHILQRQFAAAVPLKDVTIAVTARLRNVVAVLSASNSIQTKDLDQAFHLVTLLSASASVPELTDRIHDFFSFLSDQSPRDSVKKSTLILEFIEANYKNPALGAQLLCDRFRISPTYLSRLIKTETGQGLLDCIHAARVKNAKTLLANTNLSIEQVALQVGFSNRYGLIRAFRAIEGMTPSEYRSLIDAGH